MAKPNISLLGAIYSEVSGVTLPKQGGGTATFPWVEGSETKTQNGTYDVTSLAELIVNVAGGGGSGLVYETGTYTPTADTARPTISFTNTHSEAPVLIAMSDTSAASGITSNSNLVFMWFDMYKLFGSGFPTSTSALAYAYAEYYYRSSNSNGGSRVTCTKNSDSTGDSSTNYPRYWAKPTGFYPYSNSSSRYWRKNRNYKWIAVWKPTS